MSNFVVSARKYRPQRFDEVVGQQHVSQTLKNALQSDHLAHAFLFCGPRGVGKTTCARILAKVLNCQNPTADFEPCNSCHNCTSFNANASFNITELDAASNNSVEHIRVLIEQVRFQPQQGKYKVFIIDEVHMLSQAAFNAFLKTLEEPPSYAIFILATTEKHKIIPTILSRCQIFDFRRIQPPDTVEHLAGICRQEGIQADHDALHIIAQKADGALRDALSIFDRIVAFSGNKITYEDVISNLNVLDYDYFFRVVDALLGEDISQTLLIFDEIVRKGFEPDLFINGLAEHLRNLLVCRDPETLALLESSDNLRERYAQQAQQSPNDFLLTALNLANGCDINYKLARNKRLHVEMCLIKMAGIGRAFRLSTPPVEEAAPEKKRLVETKPAPKETEVAPSSDAGEAAQPASLEPEKREVPSPDERAPAEKAPSPPPRPRPATAPAGSPPANAQHALEKADLRSLMATIREEQAVQVSTVEAVTLTEVQDTWHAYVEQAERDSIKVPLQSAELSVEGLSVLARVGSSLAENTIRQETGLMEYLREQLQAPNLTLAVEIDPSLRKDEPVERPKILSAKEKYLLMREHNPAVEELRKRFDLRPDE